MKDIERRHAFTVLICGLLLVAFAPAAGLGMSPCDVQSYQVLHRKALDSISDRELFALTGLHDNCLDWVKERDYPVVPCEDSVYLKLSQQPPDSLSPNQYAYLMILNEDCADYHSDVSRDKKWRHAKPRMTAGITLGVLAAVILLVVVPIAFVVNFTNSSR